MIAPSDSTGKKGLAAKRKPMRLTVDHVDRVPKGSGNYSSENFLKNRRMASKEEQVRMARDMLASAPDPRSVWVFAYGSLIWNPGFAFVEQRPARAHGWHRSFCLGWDMWFRGCVERPGLMLALDRGGRCSGVVFRLPPETAEANLHAIVVREVIILPHPFPPRWIDVQTADGPVRALTFAMDRSSGAYVSGLTPHQVADVLASASGQGGSMADYLYRTVSHLDQMGLSDRYLWQLQELVAARIEAGSG